MNTPLTVFGVAASLASLAMLYYNYKVLKAFRQDRDLAATKMILRDEIPEAFRNLSLAALLFSTGSLIGAIALVTKIEALTYFSELGGIAMITGFALFMRQIKLAVVEENQDKEERNDADEG